MSPGSAPRNMIERLHGALELCPHLLPADPGPAFWPAYRGGELSCFGCASRENARISGTEEDTRCDGCGEQQSEIAKAILGIEAVVGAFGQLLRPAIIVLAGFCESCVSGKVSLS